MFFLMCEDKYKKSVYQIVIHDTPPLFINRKL